MNSASEATPDIVIDVHGLTKSFDGRAVVSNLSMQVKRGSIYGFLGPNGSGKTTTIRMLCGLLTPDEGTGTCLGYDILTETDKIKLQIGYMTQRFSLYEDLSVRENMEFIARIYGIERPVATARAAIERLGLSGREQQLAGDLSGGWKRNGWRSAPARYLARNYCCSMSRQRASIPRRGANSGTRFTVLRLTASPCSSPPTTWTRPSAVTRSPISPMANCWSTAPSSR
jgi:ABC-type transporter Mla maintaining outer membrane lipid asymmetry ATPase subunit MlaF